MGVFHDDAVLQPGLRAQFFPHCLAQQRHVMFFEPLVKDLGRDLNRQHLAIEFDWLDGSEPRFVCLRADVVLDDRQALGPDADVVEVHVLQVMGVNKVEVSANTLGFVKPGAGPQRRCEGSVKLSQKKILCPLIFDEF